MKSMVETETSKLETHVKKCILRDYKVYFVSVEIDESRYDWHTAVETNSGTSVAMLLGKLSSLCVVTVINGSWNWKQI